MRVNSNKVCRKSTREKSIPRKKQKFPKSRLHTPTSMSEPFNAVLHSEGGGIFQPDELKL